MVPHTLSHMLREAVWNVILRPRGRTIHTVCHIKLEFYKRLPANGPNSATCYPAMSQNCLTCLNVIYFTMIVIELISKLVLLWEDTGVIDETRLFV